MSYLATLTTLVSGDEGTVASAANETSSDTAAALLVGTLGGLPLFRLVTTFATAVGFPWASSFGGLPLPLFFGSSTTFSPDIFAKN
jgi:hypothetical protein